MSVANILTALNCLIRTDQQQLQKPWAVKTMSGMFYFSSANQKQHTN